MDMVNDKGMIIPWAACSKMAVELVKIVKPKWFMWLKWLDVFCVYVELSS